MSNLSKKTNGKLSDVWLKAAVVGGLWASIEIVAGSFLHNLRIPFAGSILTAQAIALLISFHKMWPVKGLIWRAGLICALMKSISPSAVILGPMSGIFFEALLLETGIIIAGRNYPGYWLGGILGMLSSLVHKVLSLLILYGFDIVEIYKNLYLFLTRQVSIENANPWVAVWIFVAVYGIAGIIASTMGIIIGNKSVSVKSSVDIKKIQTKKDHTVFNQHNKFQYNSALLLIHIIAIPTVLIMLNYFSYYYSLSLTAVYLLFCILYYKESTRRLRKPFFWVQLIIILFLAALFSLDGLQSDGKLFNTRGLILGLEMNLRAIFVVISFSSLSIELRNPLVKKLFHEGRFKNLYFSLELAFGIFPEMIKQLPGIRFIFTKPLRYFATINQHAGHWLNELKNAEIYTQSK